MATCQLADLPLEVIRMIAMNLNYTAQKALILTSRDFRAKVQPCLFEKVRFRNKWARDSFFATTKAHPELARLVRHMILMDTIERDLVGRSHRVSVPGEDEENERGFYKRFPNLVSFYNYSHNMTSLIVTDCTKRKFEQCAAIYDCLQSVVIDYRRSYLTPQPRWSGELFSLLRVPSLKTFVVVNFKLDYSFDFIQESQLDFLGLYDCDVQAAKLTELLDARTTSALKIVSRPYLVTAYSDCPASAPEMLAAISRSRSARHIEALILEQSYSNGNAVLQRDSGFKELTSLRFLATTPPHIQCIAEGLEERPAVDLDVFPPSLERLFLVGDGSVRISPQKFGELVENILQNKKKIAPRLAKIVSALRSNLLVVYERCYELQALAKSVGVSLVSKKDSNILNRIDYEVGNCGLIDPATPSLEQMGMGLLV